MDVNKQVGANEPEIFYQNVWCLYPISGAYTRVQRYLFYVTIGIAFIFRTHTWISSVAIGSVFVYSIVAAVQSIPMTFQSSLGADPDFIAVYLIVTTNVYCALMGRMYSPRFIGRKFDLFYKWWFYGFVIVSLFLDYGFRKFTNSSSNYIQQLGCPRSSRCPDPCAGQNPQVLFRGGQFDSITGAVIDSWRETVPGNGKNQTPTLGPPHVGDGHINGYQIGNSVLQTIEFTVLYPLYLLGEKNEFRPPRLTRNKAFRRLLLKRVMSNPSGAASAFGFRFLYCIHVFLDGLTYLLPEISLLKDLIQALGLTWSARAWIYERTRLEEVGTRSREKYARNLALVWYILCMLGYMAVPLFFVISTVTLEKRWFSIIPESEGIQAVGQWGPIVGLAWTLTLAYCFRFLVPKPKSHHYEELGEGEYDPFAYEPSQEEQAWFWKYRILATPVREWRDLKHWFRDPIAASIEIEHSEHNQPTEQNPPVIITPLDLSDDTIGLLPTKNGTTSSSYRVV
ncbi:hypothetical protein F5Y12DRAFT_714186 [Xylaria sp. FL1777]|nr:hypothetical protein F5Y12DRAFT_714186 [Xylaria sp. FL1777]